MKNDIPPFQLLDPAHELLRRELVRKYGSSSYMCGIFTRAFAQRFPELKQVPGYYFTSAQDGWSRGEHWWLTDAAGTIIDPTADQFPEREHGHYVPYNPRVHMVAKGKCPCCCGPLYASEGQTPCSPECDEEVSREYDIPLTGKRPYESEMEFTCDLDLVIKYGCKFTKEPTVAGIIDAAAAEYINATCMTQT